LYLGAQNVDCGVEVAGDDVEVDGCGRHVGMTEEFLDGLKGSAAFYEPCGEVVPEAVGGDVGYAGAEGCLFDDGVQALGLDGEDPVGGTEVVCMYVCSKGFCQGRNQGDDPVLVPFASADQEFAAGNVARAEAQQLSSAEAGEGQGHDDQ